MAAFLFDLDGVIYNGDVPINGASKTLAWIRELKIPYIFVSNTTSRSRGLIVERLRKMGMSADESQILTPSVTAVRWLRDNIKGQTALFVREEAVNEFKGLDILPADREKGADAVVVGDMGEAWDFFTMNRAFRLLISEPRPKLLALGMTSYWKAPDGLRLDTAPFIAALENASNAKALVFGKPSPAFFKTALDLVGAPASNCWMVGDDIHNDIEGAQKMGIRTLMVRTGKFRPEDLEIGITPDLVLDSIADLPQWWERNTE